MEANNAYLVFLVIFQALSNLSSAGNSSALKHKLFDGYDRELRPVCDVDTVTNVTISVALRQILRLNSPSQEITINVWIRLKWMDCRLVWNETQYGLTHLHSPATRIWIPDLTIYDDITGHVILGITEYRVKIYSNGQVVYNWPSVISTFCKLSVRNFPMDKQVCKFIYSSWVYSSEEVDWVPMFSSGDLSGYEENAEWTVEKYIPERHSVLYTCCTYPFVDITFSMHIRRRPLFHVMNLIFPCVLITALTLLGFLMPVESGEKVSLQITVMLSLAVFLLVISEHIPPSSESMPYVGIYFACTLALVTTSCIMTIAVLHVHFKLHSRVPYWAKKYIIVKLGRLLFVGEDTNTTGTGVSSPPTNRGNKISHTQNDNNKSDMEAATKCMNEQTIFHQRRMNEIGITAVYNTRPGTPKYSSGTTDTMGNNVGLLMRGFEEHLSRIEILLHSLVSKRDAPREEAVLLNEWRLLACVIDRIFFILCLAFHIATTVVLFTLLEE